MAGRAARRYRFTGKHRVLSWPALLALPLLAACSASPGTAAGQPSPSPSATAAASPRPSPSPSASTRSVVLSWARFALVDVAPGTRAVQSPDGSRLFTGSAVVGLDGTPVGTVAPSARVAWRWADDSRHLCAAYADGSPPPSGGRLPATLYEVLPGSAPGAIAPVGYVADQSSPGVIGCSFGHGTATVAEVCVMVVCELWTVDLLTHAVRWHLAVPAGSGVTAVASPDDTLVAVSGPTAASPAIWSTADGSVAARPPAGTQVLAFTGDDGAALVQASGSVELVDWRTWKVLATLPGSAVQGSVAEPGGSRLAVALGSPFAGPSGYPPPADVVAVGSDGRVAPLGQAVLPQF